MTWLSARTIVEYNLYRVGGDDLAGTPDVTVLYTFDDDEVTILGIRAEKVDPDEE